MTPEQATKRLKAIEIMLDPNAPESHRKAAEKLALGETLQMLSSYESKRPGARPIRHAYKSDSEYIDALRFWEGRKLWVKAHNEGSQIHLEWTYSLLVDHEDPKLRPYAARVLAFIRDHYPNSPLLGLEGAIQAGEAAE